MSDNYKIIGRVSPVYQGIWSSTATYKRLDIVSNDDKTVAYIARQDVPAGAALTDTSYWSVVLDVSQVLASVENAADDARAAAAIAPDPLALTAQGQPAQIWPEAGSPLRPVITLLPLQPGSGDPSPDNVRPIAGRTDVTVTQSGKNLCPPFEQGTISDGGFPNDSNAQIRTVDYIPVVPGVSYTLSRTISGGDILVRGYDANKSYVGAGSKSIATATNDTGDATTSYPMPAASLRCTITVLSGIRYIKLIDVTNDLTNQYQLEVGAAATEYEPYSADACTIPLGDTYYQGTLDVNTGELILDKKSVSFTGTERWGVYAIKDGTYRNQLGGFVTDQKRPALTSVDPNLICSHFKSRSSDYIWKSYDGIGLASDNNVIYVYDSRYNTQDNSGWMAYLAEQYAAGTPVQMVYELNEPVNVQLSPALIPALGGFVVVTSSGDGMDVTYSKSLVREHEELTAQLAALENQSHMYLTDTVTGKKYDIYVLNGTLTMAEVAD